MKTEPAIEIGFPGYYVHRLALEDSGKIQALLEKCQDYMLLVEGRPAGPHAGEAEYRSVPPGKSLEDKFLFGMFNQQNDLVGLLDVLRGYPDQEDWWIGLLLFAPEVRSQGIGRRAVQALADYIQGKGGRAILLGVVEENNLAFDFWKKMGFEFVRKTEPRQFGDKTQTVTVLRRALPVLKRKIPKKGS